MVASFLPRLLVSLLLGVPAVVAGAASVAGPTTVLSFPGVTRAVAYDGSHLAWIETTWELRLRTLRNRAQSTISYTSQYEEAPGGRSPRLVFDGGHALWLSVRGSGMGHIAERVYTARRGQSRGRVLSTVKRSDASDYWTVLGVGGLAYGVALVRAEITPCDVCTYVVAGGGVWTVDAGVKHAVPDAPPSALLARSGRRIALAPADTSAHDSPTVRASGEVEVRDSRSGAVITRFKPSAHPLSLALSADVAAVLVGARAHGRPARLERYDPDSGRMLGTTRVNGAVKYDLDVSGTRIVFHDARTISALDSTTGRVSVIARAAGDWRVVDVDISGRTLVWAESRGVLSSGTSRRNAASRIRSLPLR